MGEPSLAGLLAALRAACPYPLDHVLNPAGNSVIGLNATKARFQMRGTVAVRQHAWRTESARAGLPWAEGKPVSNQKSRAASRQELIADHRASQCDPGAGQAGGCAPDRRA
jgi:hypothetical protein